MKSIAVGFIIGTLAASVGGTFFIVILLLLFKIAISPSMVLIIFGIVICLNIIGISFSRERWNTMISIFRGAKK